MNESMLHLQHKLSENLTIFEAVDALDLFEPQTTWYYQLYSMNIRYRNNIKLFQILTKYSEQILPNKAVIVANKMCPA